MLSCKNVVLVVEDHALVRALTCELLASAGFEVLQADSGNTAVDLLESRTDVELLLTGIDLPGVMDGVGLSNIVRNRWSPVNLIVATGKLAVDQRDLPAFARLFYKPFDGHAVVEAVTDMLQAA